uniref:Secreted protein n=1 Tax=Triticum urartu TaxID=4572 RepID=A0A8R7UK16_TRIUA
MPAAAKAGSTAWSGRKSRALVIPLLLSSAAAASGAGRLPPTRPWHTPIFPGSPPAATASSAARAARRT